jgi:hypothetical protein
MFHGEFSRQHSRTNPRRGTSARALICAVISAMTAAAATLLIPAQPSIAALPTWPANPNW